MDYRLPENRMTYFTKLYAFNLKNGIMPGLVYRYMPQLAKHFKWDGNQKLWFAFLNGMTQNPITSLRMFNRMPEPGFKIEQFDEWFNENWENIQFDTDRRYQKKDTVDAIRFYADRVANEYDHNQCTMYPTSASYSELWETASSLYSFGRLSTFSYLEYVKIMGFGTDCDNLMFSDKSGSKSHRNGMLFLKGQDNMVWDKRQVDSHDGNYDRGDFKNMCGWLEEQARYFLRSFYEQYPLLLPYGMGNFTLESNLCTFKNHFFGRRFPGVYARMAYDRILKAEAVQVETKVTKLFREMYETLPDFLRDDIVTSSLYTDKERGALFLYDGRPWLIKEVEKM